MTLSNCCLLEQQLVSVSSFASAVPSGETAISCCKGHRQICMHTLCRHFMGHKQQALHKHTDRGALGGEGGEADLRGRPGALPVIDLEVSPHLHDGLAKGLHVCC